MVDARARVFPVLLQPAGARRQRRELLAGRALGRGDLGHRCSIRHAARAEQLHRLTNRSSQLAYFFKRPSRTSTSKEQQSFQRATSFLYYHTFRIHFKTTLVFGFLGDNKENRNSRSKFRKFYIFLIQKKILAHNYKTRFLEQNLFFCCFQIIFLVKQVSTKIDKNRFSKIFI